MCTLTFIPSSTKEVIITSNRDEHISRGDSAFPVSVAKKQGEVYFPQDPKAGGTWLAASSKGLVAVLLNGAFEKHKHQPPYRLSRGILVLDSFDYKSINEFRTAYDFTNIEPFTLVQFDTHQNHILELRWDGENQFFTPLEYDQPHIWSSATLYSQEIRTERNRWFSEWIENSDLNPEKMLVFHKFGGNDTLNSITMDRGNGLQTVSISQLVGNGNGFDFTHYNLLKHTSKSKNI